MMRAGLLAAAIVLVGCVPQIKKDIDAGGAGSSARPALPKPGKCNADPVQDLIGRQQSDALGTDARQRSGARILRWLRPGQVVTLEYREDRINVSLDAQDKVTRITCG